MKRWVMLLLAAVFFTVLGQEVVWAQGELPVEDSLVDSMDLDSVQEAVDGLLGESSISFDEALQELSLIHI